MKQLKNSFVLAAFTAIALLNTHAGELPPTPQDIHPLIPGSDLPQATIYDAKGNSVQLTDAFEKPSILIFYRGGWCPYCNKHLEKLQERETDLKKLGYQIIAISPDRPEILDETAAYSLYSDNEMSAAKAFGIAYQVDNPTLKKLAKYKIDIEAASGQSHKQLPVPAVFIVKDSKIEFTYVNPDYTKRLSGDVLYEAAKFVKKG